MENLNYCGRKEEKMERVELTCGDFLKNAGIVGMHYLLEFSMAKENVDYGITDNKQALWISKDFILEADWTDLYFKTFVEYLGKNTIYQTILEKIRLNLLFLKNGSWNAENYGKEDLKYINDKLLSNSYQSGFANIRDKIENPEIYEHLKTKKMSEKMENADLIVRLEELECFLKQDWCKETFTMKSIIYNYINRFWDGKCFLLRANAKKDMREVFEKDFSEPLRKYCKSDHKKAKELCIDCGMPMESKEHVSIAFMTEMADDLARKKSAFWNCNVDAYLCPTCAFLYALSPLGFQLLGNKFVFVNTNESVEMLFSSNRKESKAATESIKEEKEKYSVWFAKTMNLVLNEKLRELTNIQVITRGTNADDRYMLSIISKDVLTVLKNTKVQEYLKQLARHPITLIKGEYLNVYELTVMNILQYHSQYALINRLLKAALENASVVGLAYWIYGIETQTYIIKKKREDEKMNEKAIQAKIWQMECSGFELRKALLKKKGITDEKDDCDECLKGMLYQLINTLSVGNSQRFIEILMRVYCSNSLQMPSGFIDMIDNTELFRQYGTAFVLGLKGSHYEKETGGHKK